MRKDKTANIQTIRNRHLATKPVLSVLIPYFGDNPVQLIEALCAQSVNEVELILYDDGTLDENLTTQVTSSLQNASLPVCLLIADKNEGRSAARNRLEAAAKADYLLFLDADMMPKSRGFLQTYIHHIKTHKPAIIFGGFAVAEQAQDNKFDLHRHLSASSDCLPAIARQELAAKHVCSSNLLVRKDVLQACPFDTGFAGWGWEDVEWAARAEEQFTITHIDNPALHLGLESAETLVRRYRDSAQNYARFAARHPKLARQLPSYKTAKLAGNIPGLRFVLPLFAVLALDPWHLIPMRLRILALKLWRAGWYAEKIT